MCANFSNTTRKTQAALHGKCKKLYVYKYIYYQSLSSYNYATTNPKTEITLPITLFIIITVYAPYTPMTKHQYSYIANRESWHSLPGKLKLPCGGCIQLLL